MGDKSKHVACSGMRKWDYSVAKAEHRFRNEAEGGRAA